MQKLTPLTEDQRWLIMNALTCQAEGQRAAAKAGRDNSGDAACCEHIEVALNRLAKTLEEQAAQAEALRDLIENADSVEVSQ